MSLRLNFETNVRLNAMSELVELLFGPLDGMLLRSYSNSAPEIAIPHVRVNEPGPAAFEHVYTHLRFNKYVYKTTRKLESKYVKRNNRDRPRLKGRNSPDKKGCSGKSVEDADNQIGNEIDPKPSDSE